MKPYSLEPLFGKVLSPFEHFLARTTSGGIVLISTTLLTLMLATWLGGIGFTMSLFISQLAFKDPQLVEQAKLGILLASLVAALAGLLWLYLSAPKQASALTPADHLAD